MYCEKLPDGKNLTVAYDLLAEALGCYDFERYEGREPRNKFDLMVGIRNFLASSSDKHAHLKNKPPYGGEKITLPSGEEGTYVGVHPLGMIVLVEKGQNEKY